MVISLKCLSNMPAVYIHMAVYHACAYLLQSSTALCISLLNSCCHLCHTLLFYCSAGRNIELHDMMKVCHIPLVRFCQGISVKGLLLV